MAAETKKVGTKTVGGGKGAASAPEKTGKVKKVKIKRVNFDLKLAKPEELGEEKTLKVSIPEAYDFAKHKPIAGKSFENSGLALVHKSVHLDKRAKKMQELADKTKIKGEMLQKTGGDKAVKVVKKAEKAAKSMIDLKAQLEAAGLSWNDIVAAAEKDAKEAAPTEQPATK